MVQLFDFSPVESQGSVLGKALGMGISRNLPQPEQMLQRRMQQGALDEFKQSLGMVDTPADISMKWAQSMAGVPGAEQLQQTILPQYQLQALSNLYNQPQQFQQGAQPPTEQRGIQQQQVTPDQQPAPIAPGVGQMLPGQPTPQLGVRGLVPAGGPPSQLSAGGPPTSQLPRAGIDPQIMQMSVMTGRPYDELARVYAGVPQEKIAAELQNISLAKSQELSNFAENKLPGIKSNELNQFMRMGTRYQNMNPEDWFRATKRDFNKYQNVKGNFSNANIPGMVSGMFRGGKFRGDALKRMENLAKPLIEVGDEDFVRSELARNDLSPTEIEMIIKPLNKTGIQDFKKLPRSPYMERDEFFSEMFAKPEKPTYDQLLESTPGLIEQLNNKISDFMVENIKPNVSILGLRERMRREKGVDWRQFQTSLNQAIDKGLQLNAEQQGELGELTNAPRDSLLWIFQDWGRWIDYLKGQK